MSITEGTVDVLRKFAKLLNCPLCGKDSTPVESLTSCGHYLCSKCVQSFVLSSENKCPNCYAINCRNDCRDNVFINTAIKISHKLVKLIDRTIPNQRTTKGVTKQLAIKSTEEPKTMSKESKSVPKFQELDDDILSIPDSFDNELFTQTSKSADNTELVSVILEGLESNCDPSPQERGSGDEPKCAAVETSAQKAEPKSCQHLSEVGVQTSQRCPKTVLKSVSIQCSATQTDKSIQTIKEVVTSDAYCCQSNNCCFQKFVESIPCNSLNTFIETFLKTLVEMKVSPTEDNQIDNKPESSLPLPLANKEANTTVPQKKRQSVKEPPKLENQLKSEEVINQVITEDNSIAEPIPTVVDTSKVKKQTKAQPTRRQSTEDKKGSKRVSIQSNNKSKKMKSIESSDEETEELDTQEIADQNVVLKESVIEIDLSVATSESSVVPTEESADKIKPKIKGPKSRQKTESNDSSKRVCAEPTTKTKKPKVYESSDEEVDEVFETKESKIDNTLRNKSNRKILPNKPQNSKAIEKPLITDSTADEITVEKKNKNSKQLVQNPSTAGQNKSTKASIEQLAENSNIENVYHFSDDQKNESIDTKQRTKRKSVPKKRFLIEESADFDNETEVNTKTTNKSKKQNEDKQKNTKHTEEEDKPKVIKYKPKPKSKQKSVLPIDDQSNKEVFKRPASPTPSITISETSSSSRSRGSSNERQKHVILFSGLDEKQKKKIEKVCRELNAEVVTDWTDKVTHLVISLADDRPKKDMICPRNAKYIKALLNNNWIVSYDWIIDSSRSNRWVDETNYEIKADKTATESELPNKSRISGQKLFAKRMFKFDAKIGSILTEFKDFVRIGGGIVVDSEEVFDRMKSKTGCERLIIVNQSIALPNTQKDGIKYVNQKAFMASISDFKPI